MAKEEEEKQTTEAPAEAPAEASEDSKASEGGKGFPLGLAIKALIVLVVAGGIGFGVGKFINAPGKARATGRLPSHRPNKISLPLICPRRIKTTPITLLRGLPAI